VITGVYHTSFTVSDLDRSLAFYRDVLGLKVVVQQEKAGDYIEQVVAYPNAHLKIALLKAEGSDHVLELIEYVHPKGHAIDVSTPNPGSAHLCFRVDDLQRTYEALVAKGVRFKSPPVRITSGVNEGGQAVYLLDPDGITLELFQPPARPS